MKSVALAVALSVDLVNANVYTKLDYIFLFIPKIWSKNHILTPVTVKGGNSVANLQKKTLYDSNIHLVIDNVYTNFL